MDSKIRNGIIGAVLSISIHALGFLIQDLFFLDFMIYYEIDGFFVKSMIFAAIIGYIFGSLVEYE